MSTGWRWGGTLRWRQDQRGAWKAKNAADYKRGTGGRKSESSSIFNRKDRERGPLNGPLNLESNSYCNRETQL